MPPKGEIKTVHLYGFTNENRPDHNRTVYAKVTLPKRLPRKEAIAKAVEMIPKSILLNP